jgi:hypothetical protein
MNFQVPNRGLVKNLPPHLVGPDALVDGQNVFVDLDGVLKTRTGLLQVGSQFSPAERIIGLANYEDSNGIFFPTAGTSTRWQAQIAGTWTDISGGSYLTGNINNPIRFTTFPSNGKIHLIGCNNSDVLHEWDSSLAAYTAIAASPISRDVLTLANRVVCLNTVEGGTRYPFRVRWSSINDETTWGSLNFADLADSACSIVGGALTSRTSAVIYRQFAAWYIQAVPGGDASAFAFDRIPAGDHMTGPPSPASIVIAEGNQYYFGVDGRIYMFNGSSIQPISDPVDPVLRGLYNTSDMSRFHSCYVPQYRQLCFFFALGQSTDPNACLVFDLRRQAFEPLWVFPYVISASQELREAVGPNWTNWVSGTATWLTEPWATWASIPSGNSIVAYVGDSNGNAYRFGVSNQDAGQPIPYFAKWGLQRPQNELSNALVHYVEFYQPQSLTDDTIIATILGYFQPLGSVTTVTSMTLITSNQTTFYKTLPAGPSSDNNLKSNLLQLALNASGAFGQFAFNGCTLLLDVDLRGDPRQGNMGQ